jgi:hypothetical protein
MQHMKGTLHMRRGTRAALGAAAIGAMLAFAGGAFAANTGTVAIWHTPMALGSSGSTTIHVSLPKTSDPVARLAFYAPPGYSATLNQAAGTKIGSVTATAFSFDNGLTLPLDGTVNADNPATHTADACSPGTHAAVWILNLSVAGQTLQVPAYVDPTSGAETALGSFRIVICLPPPDVPAGTPGRAAFGAQLLDAQFTVDGIFTTPTAGGVLRWETLFTPYNAGKGTPNLGGTFEARSLVMLPVTLTMSATYTKKKLTYTLKGKLSEGGLPSANVGVGILRGTSGSSLAKISTATTKTDGAFTSTGKVKRKKTTFFKAVASAAARDFTAQGCTNPLPATVAPAGCVSATLPPVTATSAVVKLKS